MNRKSITFDNGWLKDRIRYKTEEETIKDYYSGDKLIIHNRTECLVERKWYNEEIEDIEKVNNFYQFLMMFHNHNNFPINLPYDVLKMIYDIYMEREIITDYGNWQDNEYANYIERGRFIEDDWYDDFMFNDDNL
jgi:hypothetical protein